MEIYRGFESLFDEETNSKWNITKHADRLYRSPLKNLGFGTMEYRGDFDTYLWMLADVGFYDDYVNRKICHERYIEIGESTSESGAALAFYTTKSELHPVEKGLNCFVNTNRYSVFSRLPGGARIQCTDLILLEPFFVKHDITLPQDFWATAAVVLNPSVLYIPEISGVLRQIGNALTMGSHAVDAYLRAKALEVAALLIEYVAKRNSKLHMKPERAGTGTEQALLAQNEHQSINASKPLGQKEMLKIEEAKDILRACHAKPPMLAQLSLLVGLNKNKLQQGFKQSTGLTVWEFVQACRMERSLDLLQEDRLSIAQVARALGYQSPANFYKAFNKTFSISPREMRMLLRD